MTEGAADKGRTIDDVALASTVMVVTGHDEDEMAASATAAKMQIAFYASTPAYAGVLDLHGWDFGPTLNAMSKRGQWSEMASVVPDEVLQDVAVVAPLSELGSTIRDRYGDRLQRIGFYSLAGNNWTEDELACSPGSMGADRRHLPGAVWGRGGRLVSGEAGRRSRRCPQQYGVRQNHPVHSGGDPVDGGPGRGSHDVESGVSGIGGHR